MSHDLKTVSSERILSIDAFRGLTILVMIFVNDLWRVNGVPWWMKHIPGNANGMTFVDVVFPAFLFIVGMSVPFAFKRRFDKGEKLSSVWQHVIIRAAGLLLIGVYMVNMENLDRDNLKLNSNLWVLLLFISVILIWNKYPRVSDSKKYLFTGLRYLGCAILIFLAVKYKGRGENNMVCWMKTSWWGILGLIGWAYLTSCSIYLVFRKNLPAMIFSLFLLLLLYLADAKDMLYFLQPIKEYVWLGGQIGSHSSITLCGIIVACLFLEDSPAQTPKDRIKWIAIFAAGLFIAGYFLYPFHGINKNNATPTWCLYSSAICCCLYIFLYWLMDLKGYSSWAKLIQPAGANPLLAYILPYIVSSITILFGVNFLSTHLNNGALGIATSAVYSFFVVFLTGILGRLDVNLKL